MDRYPKLGTLSSSRDSGSRYAATLRSDCLVAIDRWPLCGPLNHRRIMRENVTRALASGRIMRENVPRALAGRGINKTITIGSLNLQEVRITCEGSKRMSTSSVPLGGTGVTRQVTCPSRRDSAAAGRASNRRGRSSTAAQSFSSPATASDKLQRFKLCVTAR